MICYAGGARGSDYYWSLEAEKAGFEVVAFSFHGHDFTGKPHWCRNLTPNELESGRAILQSVALRIGRPMPLNPYVLNLMLRTCTSSNLLGQKLDIAKERFDEFDVDFLRHSGIYRPMI